MGNTTALGIAHEEAFPADGWRTAEESGANGCLAINTLGVDADGTEIVGIASTERPEDILGFPAGAVAAFVAEVKTGSLDGLAVAPVADI